MIPLEVAKREAIRLRIAERRSLRDIAKILGRKPGTVGPWLEQHPLTLDEQRALKSEKLTKKRFAEISKHWTSLNGQDLPRNQKGRIAEAAILFRLALRGFEPFRAAFEGSKTDWLVKSPNGRVSSVQVRWIRQKEWGGLPQISLMCGQSLAKAKGQKNWRRMRNDEFDFIVGYELSTDTAYIFSSKETSKHKCMISVNAESVEAWAKLL